MEPHVEPDLMRKPIGGYGLDDADLAGPAPKVAGKSKLPKDLMKPLIDDAGAVELGDFQPTLGQQFGAFGKPLFSPEDVAEAAQGGPRNVMAEQAAEDIKAHPPPKKPNFFQRIPRAIEAGVDAWRKQGAKTAAKAAQKAE
jgi:hypothetical protein